MSHDLKFEEIRRACLKRIKPGEGHHLINNLSWHRYSIQIDRLSNSIPKNSRVLDIGCGRGFTSAMLASERKDLEVVGMDLHKWDIWKDLKKYGPKFVKGDATSMKFEKSSFDDVVAFGVLEHADDKVKFLSEVNRILKKNGKFFVLYMPNKYSLPEFFAKRLKLFHHDYKLSLKETKNLLENNGFKIINHSMEFLIPAQFTRISKSIGKIFDKNYIAIQKLDDLLNLTPIKHIASDIRVDCEKAS